MQEKEESNNNYYAGHYDQAILEYPLGSHLQGSCLGTSIQGGTHVLLGCGDGVANHGLEQHLPHRSRNHKIHPTLDFHVLMVYSLLCW